MKILAFSDWRVQSINMLNSIIQENKPDSILYAGDDLEKVIPMERELYLKTDHNFIKINEDVILNKKLFVVNEKNEDLFKNYLKKANLKEFVKLDDIPLYYVNGNDDVIIKKDGNFFIRISRAILYKDFKHYFIVETPKHKITTIDYRRDLYRGIFDPFDIEEEESDISDNSTHDLTGFYRQLSFAPSVGLHEILKNYSFYGIECKIGLNSKILNRPTLYSDIFLSHLPPLGCLDLSTRYGTRHIGSEELLPIIKEYNPKFVICGHSHFWGGKTVEIDETTVINISSHDNSGAPGNYVIIDTETDKYEIKIAKIKNIRQIRGTSFKSEEFSKIFGAFEVIHFHNLLDGDNEPIIKSLEQNNKKIIADRIRSIGWEKPKIIKRLSFNPEDYAMVDIETGLFEATGNPFGEKKIKMWLIGVLNKGELVQFEYPSQKVDFIKFIKQNNISDLVSWTKFDSKILSKIREFRNIKWHDACQRTTFSVVWHSYKLQDLYNAIFNKTELETIDGAAAGIYANHLIINNKECKFCLSIDVIKSRIKEKNKNDLLQMFELCYYLRNYEI
ncbi:MAG: metallophosphoesterase [Bacteroidia bacterium]|nr:metallophosphoesterase [Bacteroidia bacterium]